MNTLSPMGRGRRAPLVLSRSRPGRGVDEFEYTFDSIADLVADLLAVLVVSTFALYLQEYGAPFGWLRAFLDEYLRLARPVDCA